MEFLCTTCGEINSNEELVCSNCHTKTDESFYKGLLNYCNRAIRYGYDYRMYYEEQVQKDGQVNGKASLIAPTTIEEWLAAVVLAGIIGNGSYAMVIYLAKKLRDKLLEKKATGLTSREKKLVKVISNEDDLKRFASYIQDYYCGNKTDNEKVNEAIDEEILVDAVSDKLVAAYLNKGGSEKYRGIYTQARKEIEEQQRPSQAELNNLFSQIPPKEQENEKADAKPNGDLDD